MAEFIRVGSEEDFHDGRGRAVELAGERVAVFRVGERWYALQDDCPHMGASLAEGALEGGRVVCRWHGKTFDLTTGESDMRSGACARIYEVKTVGTDVFVKPPSAEDARPPTEDDWEAFDPDRHLKKG
jgi:nitrite reductase (NADH) small subunit/3-phenylpropionate/trans-cinnamate dioxygenase ferredoxin subunit